MASLNTVLCGVCDSQLLTSNAQYWCPECDEGLCSQCLNHHNASKSSRNHGVITVENYKQLPPSIANISRFCSQHDRTFHDYCPQHDSLCCPLCIQSNHATCVGIVSLEKIKQTAQTSALFESLDRNLKDIKLNVEKIVEDRKQNLTEIQKQRQTFLDEIKQVRNKINEYLDSLEQRIIQDLYASEKEIQSQIEDLLGELAKYYEKLDLLQTYMSAIKKHASDLQAFLGSKMIETEIQSHELFMQSLFDDERIQKIGINCKFEHNVSNILSFVTSFGLISVESSSPLVTMQTGKDKQAQIRSIHYALTTINDIKMTLKREFEFTGVTGCSFF